MADVVASPSDPVFFMHHGFVDHSWHLWQNGDPNNRLYQISGNTIDGQPVTLDYVLTSNGIRPPVTVRDMMDVMGGFLCYRYDY
jgi:tyrosinase